MAYRSRKIVDFFGTLTEVKKNYKALKKKYKQITNVSGCMFTND